MNDSTTVSGIDLSKYSAVELARLIRRGELSSRTVVETHIARIESVDPELNAVVIRLFNKALAAADAADDALARGDDVGPLHGVPITVKEQFRVAGTETTCGLTSKLFKTYDDEGPMVSSLRQAGAIILGKTNIMQALSGWECDNPVYGRANNPWDLLRTPGGSSGGEGAIIAAGGSPLGLASDLGGSIRFPAYFCGVHGFKPTSGRLSNRDTPPDVFSLGQEGILPQPGPIARRVEDLSLAMSILSSARTDFDVTPPVVWQDPASVNVANLRIGYYTDNDYFPVSPAIRRVVNEAAEALARLGADVVEMQPPDTEEGMRLFVGIFSSDGSAGLKKSLGHDKPVPSLRSTIQGSMVPNKLRGATASLMERRGQRYMAQIIRWAGSRTTKEYWGLVEARNVYRQRFIAQLERERIDVVLSPPFALPAPQHDATEHLVPAGSYALVYSVLGVPVGVVSTSQVQPGEESDRIASSDNADKTAVKVELGSAGLPVGVQVAARHWRDDIALAVMAALESSARTKDDYPASPPIT